MKLTFKDLKQQKFVIEAEPSETIGEVKAKISAEKGWEPGQQKLIYSGKILQDANTVESYKIEEKGFIVCMVQKPKTAPASSSAAASSSSAQAPSTPAHAVSSTPAPPPAPAQLSNPTTEAAPSTPTPASSSSNFNDPSALALGSQRDAAIADMVSMGFDRSQIDRAMRAAFNNPTRAVEYLINGIPNAPPEPAESASATAVGTASETVTSPTVEPSGDAGDEHINLFEAAAQAGRSGGGRGGARAGAGGLAGLEGLGGTGAGRGGAGAGTANLDFLRNSPQFQQLRQLVQTQPGMLQSILQQVGVGNPQLAQMIGQNPEQFIQLLSEMNDDDAPLPPGAQAVSVTEEEREAIERLCRLGFERDLVIQAYFACDKNEELAANFLFDQPMDEDEQ